MGGTTDVTTTVTLHIGDVRDVNCHVWTGAKNQYGYGRRQIAGVRWLAHRWAWVEANGPIPSGLLVLHRCDNPACVNPAHLYLGTQTDNMRDCFGRGRNRNGQESKTHCPQGHPYDAENTYRRRDGARACKECRRQEVRRRRARRR